MKAIRGVLASRLALAGALVAGVAVVSEPSSARDVSVSASAPLAASQHGRRYLTIGTNDRRQFTESEYQTIAENYDVVVFAKFHGGWDIALHHEATRRLKEINPDLRIFAYMSTKYWFNGFRWGEAVIDPNWFLRDDGGDPIPVTKKSQNLNSKVLGYYVDVTNQEYRAWLLRVARSWLAVAPYDGIRFDAADHIGDHGKRDVRKWQELLAPERIARYNEGIDLLLRTFESDLDPKEILFNGFSPGPIRGSDRDLFMLDFTDGAMDESFCAARDGELHDILADIEIMQRYATKSLQLRAKRPVELDADNARRIERVCVGSFLIGWQPGSTYFNMGSGYGTDQLTQQPPDIDIDLGEPLASHVREGSLLQREFENGVVYVNLGSDPLNVSLPRRLVLLDGAIVRGAFRGSYALGAEDAAFFLNEEPIR